MKTAISVERMLDNKFAGIRRVLISNGFKKAISSQMVKTLDTFGAVFGDCVIMVSYPNAQVKIADELLSDEGYVQAVVTVIDKSAKTVRKTLFNFGMDNSSRLVVKFEDFIMDVLDTGDASPDVHWSTEIPKNVSSFNVKSRVLK